MYELRLAILVVDYLSLLLRARQLYGAKDARKRRNGTGNPLSLVEGIVPRIRV